VAELVGVHHVAHDLLLLEARLVDHDAVEHRVPERDALRRAGRQSSRAAPQGRLPAWPQPYNHRQERLPPHQGSGHCAPSSLQVAVARL